MSVRVDCKQTPQTGWLKTTEIESLIIREARSPESSPINHLGAFLPACGGCRCSVARGSHGRLCLLHTQSLTLWLCVSFPLCRGPLVTAFRAHPHLEGPHRGPNQPHLQRPDIQIGSHLKVLGGQGLLEDIIEPASGAVGVSRLSPGSPRGRGAVRCDAVPLEQSGRALKGLRPAGRGGGDVVGHRVWVPRVPLHLRGFR